MKRFSDGNMGGPFKRSRMGPDDIEVRLLIPSKVSQKSLVLSPLSGSLFEASRVMRNNGAIIYRRPCQSHIILYPF